MEAASNAVATSTPTSTPGTPSPTPPAMGNKPSPANGTENLNANSVVKQMEEFFEIPVNGKTQKLSREQVIARAAQASAAQDRFEKANKIFADARQRQESMKKDLFGTLLSDKDLGFKDKNDLRAKIEAYYKQEFIDPEMMTHEQRQIAEQQRKIQEFENKQAEAEEKYRQYQQEQEDHHARETAQKDIIDVLEKGGLDRTNFNGQRTAYYMQMCLKNGWDAPPEVIAAKVKEEGDQITKSSITAALKSGRLVQVLGEENIKAILQDQLQRYKANQPNNMAGRQRAQPVANVNKNTVTRPSDVSDYFRSLRLSKK